MSVIKLLAIRDSVNVGIVIDSKYKNKIVDELHPYILIKEVESFSEDMWIVYSSIENIKDVKNFTLFTKPSPGEPNNNMLLNLKEKKIVIDQEKDSWMKQYVIRSVRNLLRWQLYEKGYFYLHGGIVEIENAGVAYLGKKKSGKTSSILSILAKCNEKYITNDDITLNIDNDIFALGWPRAIGVRNDTIEAIDKFTNGFLENSINLKHPRHSDNNVNMIDSDKLATKCFLPIEISRLLNCDIKSKTKLKVIIFPMFVNSIEDISLKHVDKKQALNYLKDNLELKPDKHSDFLADCFDILSTEKLYKKLEILADNIPCYVLKQKFNNLDIGAELVRGLVGELNDKNI